MHSRVSRICNFVEFYHGELTSPVVIKKRYLDVVRITFFCPIVTPPLMCLFLLEHHHIYYKAYKYALSILPQRAKFFSISFYNTGLYMAFGKFLLNIETTIYVLIDTLRNISPASLNMFSSIYDAKFKNC